MTKQQLDTEHSDHERLSAQQLCISDQQSACLAELFELLLINQTISEAISETKLQWPRRKAHYCLSKCAEICIILSLQSQYAILT